MSLATRKLSPPLSAHTSKMRSFFIIFLVVSELVFCVGCGTLTHHVSRKELENRLLSDTRQLKDGKGYWHQWSYIGSDKDFHYFRRQIGKMFFSGAADGIYAISKKELNIEDLEFKRPVPDDSSKWKNVFANSDSFGIPKSYDIRCGIISN